MANHFRGPIRADRRQWGGAFNDFSIDIANAAGGDIVWIEDFNSLPQTGTSGATDADWIWTQKGATSGQDLEVVGSVLTINPGTANDTGNELVMSIEPDVVPGAIPNLATGTFDFVFYSRFALTDVDGGGCFVGLAPRATDGFEETTRLPTANLAGVGFYVSDSADLTAFFGATAAGQSTEDTGVDLSDNTFVEVAIRAHCILSAGQAQSGTYAEFFVNGAKTNKLTRSSGFISGAIPLLAVANDGSGTTDLRVDVMAWAGKRSQIT